MTRKLVLKDILEDAVDAFFAIKDGDVGVYAFREFVSLIKDGDMSLAQAKILLTNRDNALSDFVADIKGERDKELHRQNQEIYLANKRFWEQKYEQTALVNKELIEKTHANSEKTLAAQDALKGLIDELHSSVKEVKDATHANAQTSADIRAATVTNETTAKAIATQVTALGKASKDIHDEVKKAVKNTSTITAVLVGLGVGFMAGLPTNYVYERHFSVEAMNKKADAARKDKDTAGSSSSPPPDIDKGTSLVALPYSGLVNPLTGKSLLDLFNEGHTVRLLKQDGSSICLQMPKPIPCVGAEVPKTQPIAAGVPAKPDKVVTPRHPVHHIRRHHPHNGCSH